MPSAYETVSLALLPVLVGLLLTWLPRLGRRGFLFGAYVGEERDVSDEARKLVRSWTRAMLAVTAVVTAIVVAFASVNGAPLAQVVSGPLLLAGVGLIYVRHHRAARELGTAPPSTQRASLVGDDGDRAPRHTHLLPLLLAGATVGVAVLGIAITMRLAPELPERIPVHYGFSGVPDRWAPPSFSSVWLVPSLSLLLAIGGSALGFGLLHAKRSLRYPGTEASAHAQERFRYAVCVFTCGTFLLATAMLTAGALEGLEVALGRAERLGHAFFVLFAALMVFVIGGAIVLGRRFGQGGAKLEREAARAPIAGDLADERHWRLGLFYVNPDDPAWFVEHRFGLGYTINFGNRRATFTLLGFLAALFAVILVGIVDAIRMS